MLLFLLPLLFLASTSPAAPNVSYCHWDQLQTTTEKQLYNCRNTVPEYPLSLGNSSITRRKVRVGLLLPRQPSKCSHIGMSIQGTAADLAIEDINRDPHLIPGFELEAVRPPPDYATCGRTFDTLGYAYTLRVEQGVDVLIGPACGDMNSGGSVASFATEEDIMVVSIASFQDQLNDVERYPTFTRIYESAIIQAYYHAAVYNYFSWTTVVAVLQREKNPKCTIQWAEQPVRLRKLGYDVRKFELSANHTLPGSNMTDILMNNRAISLFASPMVSRELVLKFHRLCLSLLWCEWANYRFVILNFQIGFVVSNDKILPWKCDQSNRQQLRKSCQCCSEKEKKDDEEAKKAFRSVIYLVSDVPKYSDQDDFFCRMMKRLLASPEVTRKPTCVEELYLIQQAYDTVLLYAHALNVTQDPANGKELTRTVKKMESILGKSGKIIPNLQGSRYTEQLAYFLVSQSDDVMTAALQLKPNRQTGSMPTKHLYTASVAVGVDPPTRVPDLPPCGWDRITCPKPLAALIGGVCGLILIIVGGTLGKIYLVRMSRPQQSFLLSQGELENLLETNIEGSDASARKFHMQDTGVSISLGDKKTISLLRELQHVHHPNIVQLFHCCIETPGLTLVLEECPKGALQHLIRREQRVKSASFIRSFAMDILKGLDYLQSSSFNYHGALTSLNCAVDGNWVVKLQGFHTRHISEGEIYGNQMEMSGMGNTLREYGKLWMAPEVLMDAVTNPTGWRCNDVYSFGIILSELIKGEPPFGIFYDSSIDPQVLRDQVEKIRLGAKPLDEEALTTHSTTTNSLDSLYETVSIDGSRGSSADIESLDSLDSSKYADSAHKTSSRDELRGYVEPGTEGPGSLVSSSSASVFDEYANLTIVRQFCLLCLQEDPAARPTVKDMLKRLESGSQHFIGSLLDQWLMTLERKTRELRAMFDTKNEDLVREKERTQELVYSLLPREIAEKKIAGLHVAPQVFSHCSFFFSDIKGFTKIVADLTGLEDGGPMDVVEMLDNLYTIMDKAIGKYSVTKIETIGDAYVVVSGLPVPDINETAHAKHIASFGLEVLSTTRNIRIRRLGDRPVFMRIGVHSGPCVAGIAGNHMFHYCIYGKEPRYANNLESSGEASRVHMSNGMRQILDYNFPSKFAFLERKPSPTIPGFKTKKTWWLVGEAGVHRDMPDDVIYKNIDFKRRISNTTNPRLIRGIAMIKAELGTGSRVRTASESSFRSDVKQKRRKSVANSEIAQLFSKKKKTKAKSGRSD